jgi:cellobiose phosphorylase
VESLLGLTLAGDKLRVTPCLPEHWDAFKVHYRYRETVYHIAILRTRIAEDEASVSVDGVTQPSLAIPLVDDHREHSVEVRLTALDSH